LNNLDKYIASSIMKFLRQEVKKRKSRVVVIGISGGIDSAVTATLAVKALGSNKVFGLILPDSSVTPKRDTKDAIELTKWLNIEYKIIELRKIKAQLLEGLPKDKLAGGNLLVRLRMILMYYHAAILNGLVIGTADKSELALGYFTKYGDGAVDLQPIADLYKTQVRSLAKYLTIPDKIVNKKSSARLWKGHTAEGELGMYYEEVDMILEKMNTGTAIDNPGLRSKAEKVKKFIEKNRHKHEMPLVCTIENAIHKFS
jgi:NAD+ synthase